MHDFTHEAIDVQAAEARAEFLGAADAVVTAYVSGGWETVQIEPYDLTIPGPAAGSGHRVGGRGGSGVNEADGGSASPLTGELMTLDAYLTQVKRSSSVPLVGWTLGT